jgi:hypothetical protein
MTAKEKEKEKAKARANADAEFSVPELRDGISLGCESLRDDVKFKRKFKSNFKSNC